MSHSISTTIAELQRQLNASRGTARRQELLKRLWQLRVQQEESQESDG